MKLNKYLKIFVVCFCLVALLSVSCFATSVQTTNSVYGFYISPGDYVLDSLLDFSAFAPGTYFYQFSFQGVISDGTENIFSGFRFSIADLNRLSYVTFEDDPGGGVYSSGIWFLDASRYITVLDGFYIYDISFYQWWQSNVSRVDSGYSSNLLDGFLTVFSNIGVWISSAVASLTSMFFSEGSLTFLGSLCIAALAMAVSFLLIAFISRFLRFRG